MSEQTQTLTIYMRLAPRLPKLLALAAIYWWWREHIKSGTLKIILRPIFESAHPPIQKMEEGRSWEYHLDCCGNGYRERGMKSELDVVMHDFEMTDEARMGSLINIARAHNVRESIQQNGWWTSRNILNKAWGSLGFLSGSAWPLISEVTAGSWIWHDDIKTDSDDNIVCDANGRPVLFRRASRESLSQDDFIMMTIEVIMEMLEMDEKKKAGKLRDWSEAAHSKVITNLLSTQFQGKPLAAGYYEFPTLSGYIRHLWMNGKTVAEVRTKLRPWMRLWRVIEQTIQTGSETAPQHSFGVCQEGRRAVAFDFAAEPMMAGVDNPLLHKGQFARPGISLVIVKRPDGHTSIFSKGFTEESMKSLAEVLDGYEPKRWFYEGGAGIYNGSNSRAEIPPSQLPVFTERGTCLIRLAHNYLRCAPRQDFKRIRRPSTK